MGRRHKNFMNAWQRIMVFILLMLLYGIKPALSADYYVAPHGRDYNPGTQSLPWQTITKATSTLIAGDIVRIASGTYPERIIPVHSGTTGKYITYASMTGAEVIVDGSAITLPNYDSGLIQIENKAFIKIVGLNIRHAGPYINNAGVYVDQSDNIIVERNTIFNTVSSGIGIWNSTNIVIDANEVELACNDGEQECITVSATNGFVVKNNHVHHNGSGTNGGEGIDAKDGSSNGKIFGNDVHDLSRLGIYVDAWDKHTHDIDIYKNKVHNCRNDGITLASEQGGLLENISVYNNLVYNNLYNGISITPNGDVAQPPMKNLSVVNNTIHNNGNETTSIPWGGGIAVDNPNIQSLIIRNNIFNRNLFFQILVDVSVIGLKVDHNLIAGYRNFDNEITGSFFVESDPLFIDSSKGDFHLAPASPAIDKGSSVNVPEEDFESIRRPQGSGYDIGAYEYVGKKTSLTGTLLLLMNQNKP